jgi:hypothetical protein
LIGIVREREVADAVLPFADVRHALSDGGEAPTLDVV